MYKLMKWLAVSVVAVWILVACQTTEPEVAVVEPTDVPVVEPTDPPPTDVPEPTDEPEPTDVPAPTDEPEPTDEPVEVEAVSEGEMAEEESAEVEAVVEEQPEREPMVVDGYNGVRYTQFDGELLGTTGKPQMLNVYARW